jgi:hypothetical protein
MESEERRRRVSKDAPERNGGATACWIILRDAALRAALRMRSALFRGGPTAPVNRTNFESRTLEQVAPTWNHHCEER